MKNKSISLQRKPNRVLWVAIFILLCSANIVNAETYETAKYNHKGTVSKYKIGFDDEFGRYITLSDYYLEATTTSEGYIRPAGTEYSIADNPTGFVSFMASEGCYISSVSAVLKSSNLKSWYENKIKAGYTSSCSDYEPSESSFFICKNDYFQRTLSIYVQNNRSLVGGYNYGAIADISFKIWIPEVKTGIDQSAPSDYAISEKVMTKNTATSRISITYDVAEGVSSSDFMAKIVRSDLEQTGHGTFSEPQLELKGNNKLVVSFTYTTENSDDFACNYSADLVITSQNEVNTGSFTTHITGSAGNVKTDNTLHWTLDDDIFVNSVHRTPTMGNNTSTPVRYSSSRTDVAYFDEEGNLHAVSAGITKITAVQDASDEYAASNVPAKDLEVKKRTAVFAFTPDGELYSGKNYANYVVLTNDPNNTLSTRITYTSSDEDMFSIASTGTLTTKAALGSATLSITAEGSDEWNVTNIVRPITIVKDPVQVPFCLNANLVSNTSFITRTGDGSYSWTDNTLQIGHSHSTAEHTTTVVLAFGGVPAQLSIGKITKDKTINSIVIKEGSDANVANNGTVLANLTSTADNLQYSLKPSTNFISITFVGVQYIYLQDLCVTAASTFTLNQGSADAIALSLTNDDGQVLPGTFTINHSNLAEITLSSDNPRFTLSKTKLDYHDGLGFGVSGDIDISVNYAGTDMSETAVITLTGTDQNNNQITKKVNVSINTIHAMHYAKATAIAGTLGGKVYLSATETTPTEQQYTDISNGISVTQHCAATQGAIDQLTFYFYALPSDGYGIKSWTDENGNAQSEEEQYSEKLTASSRDGNNPTSYVRYANFASSEVTAAVETTLPTLTSLNGSVEGEVEFDVKYTSSAEDFTVSVGEDLEFISSRYDAATHKLYVKVRYTGQGLQGNPKSSVTLTGKVDKASTMTAVVNIPINLEPKFTMSLASYDFGAVDVSIPVHYSTSGSLKPTPDNDVAQSANTKWYAEISCYDKNVFSLVSAVTADGNFQVSYSPKEAKEYSATLSIWAVYTDKNGNTATGQKQQVEIKGSTNVGTTETFDIGTKQYTFTELYGTMKGEYALSVTCLNVENVQAVWNDAQGVFSHEMDMVGSFAGTIHIYAQSAQALSEEHSYTAILTITGTGKSGTQYIQTIQVGATIRPKLENTLSFCLPDDWYVDMNNVLALTGRNNEETPISFASSNDNILSADATNLTVTGNLNGNTGEVTLTATQDETDKYKGISLTVKKQVKKHTPVFTFNPGTVLWKYTQYTDVVTSSNQENDFTMELENASDAEHLTISGKDIMTGKQEGQYNIRIHQEGTNVYEEVNTLQPIRIIKAPNHVEVTLTQELFTNTDKYLYGTEFLIKGDGVRWTGNEFNPVDSIWTGETQWSTEGSTNQFTFTKDNGLAVFHFTGVPRYVNCAIAMQEGADGYIALEESSDNINWTKVDTFHTIGLKNNLQLLPESKYIRFYYKESDERKGYASVQDLNITEASGVSIEPSELEFVRDDNGNFTPQKVIIKAANWGGTITKTTTNTDFELSYEEFQGDGYDYLLSREATVTYKGDGAASGLFTLSCTNGKSATLHVVVNATLPRVITAGTAEHTLIYTGTDKAGNFPYKSTDKTKTKQEVNVSAAFANGEAVFDRLYIFGLTTNTNDVRDADGLYVINQPNQTRASNAKTPCYIYDKEGTDKYRLVQTIPNMNVADKPIGQITANGQKLYFTGYCPYGSCGYTKDDNGIIDIKGGAGTKIDLYFDNFDMRSRPKKKSGTTIRPDTIQISLSTEMYLTGSGAAVVFQSTSKSTSNPFTPSIHLRGDNVISGTQAAYVIATLSSYKKEAGQHSSPLHILATDKDQCTTLNVDDIWQKAEGTGTERTNGSLQFNKYARNMPSIDLGNANSVLNFNGGQIHLQNSTPQSAQYISTFAIAYRTYSASVSILTATMYGLGNDQPGGTINFNDGSIYCDSLTTSQIGAFGSYYRDNKSMKCPEKTFINGGTFYSNIWACSAAENLGASPKNQYGDDLVSDTVKVDDILEPYKLAKITFPDDLTNNVEGDEHKGEKLSEYYTRKGKHYSYESLCPNTKNQVILMLPAKYVGRSAQGEVTIVPWKLCSPTIKASAGSSIGSLTFGGECSIDADDTHQTSRLAWAELDNYIVRAVQEGGYKSPVAGATLELEGSGDVRYQTISNKPAYTLEDAMYIFKPISAADEWTLFAPPFDVTNVYVLESYPEEQLKQIGTTDDADLIAQAKASMDMFYFLCEGIEVSKTASGFDALYQKWINHEKEQDKEVGWYTSGTYNLRGKRLLKHFTGSNWDADYYLYASEEPWTYDGSKFTNGWHYAPAATEVQHGEKTHKVLMHKGQVYAMNFPFMYRGYREQTEKYDYWTGKYLIFEGFGPQTIEGTDYISTMEQAFTEAGKAVLRGNATFADISVDGVSNAFILYDDSKPKTFVSPSSGIELEPMQGFLVANVPTPQGMRVKSISMQTGKVTFEEDAPTGVPTVGGDHTLWVTRTDNGIRVAVHTPQLVRIYASSGALVFDGHVETSVDVALLSAGIYVIRGEHEVQKIMVQ